MIRVSKNELTKEKDRKDNIIGQAFTKYTLSKNANE